MSENPLDIINTKYCREHVCFKAFRNGVCISCSEEKMKELNKMLDEPAKVIPELKELFEKPDVLNVQKKGRGRPKGSKNKK